MLLFGCELPTTAPAVGRLGRGGRQLQPLRRDRQLNMEFDAGGKVILVVVSVTRRGLSTFKYFQVGTRYLGAAVDLRPYMYLHLQLY